MAIFQLKICILYVKRSSRRQTACVPAVLGPVFVISSRFGGKGNSQKEVGSP